jgi:hypothetical protein
MLTCVQLSPPGRALTFCRELHSITLASEPRIWPKQVQFLYLIFVFFVFELASNLVKDMAWRWQLWLSPRPKRRTAASSESRITTAHGAALFEFFTEENGHFFVRETHYMDNPIVRKGLSGPLL